MPEQSILIIGAGIGGLATGCYAHANCYRTCISRNALGAWRRLHVVDARWLFANCWVRARFGRCTEKASRRVAIRYRAEVPLIDHDLVCPLRSNPRPRGLRPLR
jgi:hypothetical protein